MRLRKPSPAMLVALVALLVALGGSSYAAVTLSKNSVTSKHIKNGQVKRPDIAKNAVNSRKVANFSLLAKDFKPGQLPAGPKGDIGPQGPQGTEGPAGATNVLIRNSGGSGSSTPAPPDGENTEVVECPPGTRAVGGGYRHMGGDPRDLIVTESLPHPVSNVPNLTAVTPTGWSVTVFNADHNNDDA